MMKICTGGLLSFYVGAALMPSMSVRVVWALWWLVGLFSGFRLTPFLARAQDRAEEWLPYALMAAMVVWAVRARRSVIAAGCCRACGYDLSGTADAMPCPECGAVGTRVVVTKSRTKAEAE